MKTAYLNILKNIFTAGLLHRPCSPWQCPVKGGGPRADRGLDSSKVVKSLVSSDIICISVQRVHLNLTDDKLLLWLTSEIHLLDCNRIAR